MGLTRGRVGPGRVGVGAVSVLKVCSFNIIGVRKGWTTRRKKTFSLIPVFVCLFIFSFSDHVWVPSHVMGIFLRSSWVADLE